MGFEKLGSTQGHATVDTCRPSESGRDNFIGIKAVGFLNSFTVFSSSLVDIGIHSLIV